MINFQKKLMQTARLLPPKKATRPRVAIVGAGFAGMSAAKQLPASRYAVSLIDPQANFEWLPNIHEIVSGLKRGSELQLDRGKFSRGLGHSFILDRVIKIAPDKLTLSNHQPLEFDACILAPGSIKSDCGIKGVKEYGMMIKSVVKAQQFHQRVRALVARKQPACISIVGGGIEGVEWLGELLRAYRRYKHIRFQLIDSHEKLLDSCPGDLDKRIRQQVRNLPVDILLERRVAELCEDKILLESGESLPSDLTLWCAGVAPHPLFKTSDFVAQPDQWCDVKDSLQALSLTHIFVVGDAANFTDDLTKQAFHAQDMGAVAAKNIVRLLNGKPMQSYQPASKPRLVSFGDLDAFLVFDNFSVALGIMESGKEAIYNLGMLQLQPAISLRNALKSFSLLQRSLLQVYLGKVKPRRLLTQLADAQLLY